MKINKRKRIPKTKRSIILATLVLLVVFGLLFAYLYLSKGALFGWSPHGSASDSKINYNEASDEQKVVGTDIKRNNNSTNNSTNSAKNDSDKSTQPSTTPADRKQTTSVTIVSASQDITGNLNLRAIIDTIEPGSTCTLKIYNNNQEVYVETVDTSPQPSYSACIGFNVPKDQLGNRPANISFTVSYVGKSYEGDATKEMSIK